MVALPLQQGLCLSAKEHLGTARAFCPHKLPGRVRLASRKPAMNVRCGESSGHRNGIGDGDGIIIVDHGSRSQDSNIMLNSFVAMFKEKTGYAIVEPAHMELAKPSIEDAFYVCVQQGAKRIIVSPFFLSPGRHWKQDIPNLASEAAKKHPGISFMVTAPLGLHELLVDIMNDRIRYCLSHVAGDADECASCRGTGKCREISIHVAGDADYVQFVVAYKKAMKFCVESLNGGSPSLDPFGKGEVLSNQQLRRVMLLYSLENQSNHYNTNCGEFSVIAKDGRI